MLLRMHRIQLFPITGMRPDARLDFLDYELDHIGDQLTLRCVVRGCLAPAEQRARYALEK